MAEQDFRKVKVGSSILPPGSKCYKMKYKMAEFKRSRLARQESDEITRKTVVLGVITVLLFIFILVFGLPLLIKFSIFLGETKNNKSNQGTQKVIPPLPPRLILPFEATNSSEIIIKGVAEPKLEVELLKNDIPLEKKEIDDKGDFIFENVGLDEGLNVFTAVVIGKDNGSSEVSKESRVVLDKNAPEMTMINPSEENVTVDYADFDVVGKSEKGVSVMVNNHVAIVDDEGKFKIKVQLNSGNNNIEIKVRDLAGNETKKNITIKYDI